jgi:hypothetical protein
MDIKNGIAVRLGVTYGSRATNRKQGGLPLRASLPHCTPIGRVGVIYDSQLVEIHKNTTTNRWKHLYYFLIEKSPKTAFLK